MPKLKILMVCLGNICRSPLAEGILKNKITSKNVYIDSAGTAAYHIGNSPDPRSIAVAKTHGINISKFTGRQFKSNDFDKFDYIYVMDKANLEAVLKLSRSENDKQKVSLILNTTTLISESEVPDPYYGDNTGFNHVYNLLDIACTEIAKTLNTQINER